MTDSKYKLTYFPLKGLAESIRMIFAYAKVDFKDVRILQDDWPELKKNYPKQKLPVLEVDGKVLNQSVAICRFLGTRFGLVPKDPFKAARLDALVDDFKDVQEKLRAHMTLKTPEAKKEMDDILESFLKAADEAAAEGYMYGSTISWVDIYITVMAELFPAYLNAPDMLKPYPRLVKLTEKVRSQDGIKKWMETRPADNYIMPSH